MAQSQKHGFVWENMIRVDVLGLEPHPNDTQIWDVKVEENTVVPGENLSVKCTSSNIVDCGDALRMFQHSKGGKMIIVVYHQSGQTKTVDFTITLPITEAVFNILWGKTTRSQIKVIDDGIKSLAHGTISKDIRRNFGVACRDLKNGSEMFMTLNPKIDSHSQRRLQCSFNLRMWKKLYPDTLRTTKGFVVYGHKLNPTLDSPVRHRHPKTA